MEDAAACPWRRSGEGLLVAVRLTPKAARDAIEGIEMHGGRTVLKARVRAAPEKGKANSALEKLMAKWLGIAQSRVSLVSGGASRLKTVFIAGEPEAVAAAIARAAGKDI